MESTGEPLKIHCSEQIRALLETIGGYEIEKRGIVPMKGKGEQMTYWLLGHVDTPSSNEGVVAESPFHSSRDQSPTSDSQTNLQKESSDKNHNNHEKTKRHSTGASPIRKFFARRTSNTKIPIPIVLEEHYGDHNTNDTKVAIVPEESPLLGGTLANTRTTCT
jgi:hypothetical protein